MLLQLWNTFHAKEHVKPIAEKQLKDFGLDYFDLYLIHFRKSTLLNLWGNWLTTLRP